MKNIKKFLGLVKKLIPIAAVMIIVCSPAFAAESADSNAIAINTVWTLVAAFLVFFMQPGFALVEVGFTRAKNASNILMKNLMDFSIGSIAFWAVGFGIMFGADKAGVFGSSGIFLSAASPATGSGLWQFAYWMFQVVFAATAATIVSGAMAERTRFPAYLIYSFFICALIYPVAGHWIWGGGWLGNKGMIDFAGSTVVHSVGGWAALAGVIFLGPRLGKYNRDGSSNAIPGHNIPLAALGVFILWFGWFGFNPGSTMAAVPDIAHIATTTVLAGGAGVIGAVIIAWIIFKKPDVTMGINGVIAGLVAITAPTAFVSPGSAVAIGFLGGIIVVLAVVFIDRVMHVDDPVGCIAGHAACGVWGTFALGLFAQDKFSPGTTGDGLFFGGGWKLLGAQTLGIVSVAAYSLLAGFLLFYVIKKLVGLRVKIGRAHV